MLPDVIELRKRKREKERMKIHMHELYISTEEWGGESGRVNSLALPQGG